MNLSPASTDMLRPRLSLGMSQEMMNDELEHQTDVRNLRRVIRLFGSPPLVHLSTEEATDLGAYTRSHHLHATALNICKSHMQGHVQASDE
jgi:hypothetical protein